MCSVFILGYSTFRRYWNCNSAVGSASPSDREQSGKTQVYTYTCINITSPNDSDSVLRDRLKQNDGTNGVRVETSIREESANSDAPLAPESMIKTINMISETWYRIIIVSFLAVLSTAEPDYDNKLTKLWSLSSASKSDGSAILNVTSASIVIQPTNQGGEHAVSSRRTKDLKGPPPNYSYAFRPRTIPIRGDQQIQDEKNVYYSQDTVNKYKSEVPFPGNYRIAKEKGGENLVKKSPYNYINVGAFHPRAIPLIVNPEFEGRSLHEDEEPVLKKPEGFSELTASRRSLSFLGGEDDEEEPYDDDEEEDGEYETGEETDDKGHTIHGHTHNKNKKKIDKKTKKMTKYMMPLLLAYKLKYFALVPVMIAGLILLVGATGLAGFFFALFAAVMGLQKGGY